MTWQMQLKGDALSWLLEENDPGVRYLALSDLLDISSTDCKIIFSPLFQKGYC